MSVDDWGVVCFTANGEVEWGYIRNLFGGIKSVVAGIVLLQLLVVEGGHGVSAYVELSRERNNLSSARVVQRVFLRVNRRMIV